MQITYFGHSCLLFEWGKTRLLCDPWTSDRGAFHAAWFQFPDVSEVAPLIPRDPTHIYISNEHQDHLDPTFLKGVSEDTEFLISDHPSPWVRRGLVKLGFSKIIEMESERPALIDGARVAVIRSDDPGTAGSALWVSQGAVRYLNQSDCEFTGPFLGRLRAQFPADVHFLRYAPASWFPMVYEYAEERKRTIYPQRRRFGLDKFVTFVAAMKARHVVGIAGPAAFLDPAWLPACLPSGGIMPTFSDPGRAIVHAGLHTELSVPLPGDALDVRGRVSKRGPFEGWDDSDAARTEYLLKYAERKKSKIAEDLAALPRSKKSIADDLAEHLRTIAARAPYFAKQLNTVVRFVITDLDEQVTLDATKDPAVVTVGGAGPANYTITTQSWFLRPQVAGEWNWDHFLLSMRYKAHRDPDEYNPWLQYFLSRSTEREVRMMEDFFAGDVFEKHIVEAAGHKYEIERWCPHSRCDLARGHINGVELTCPVHHIRFNLETGGSNSKGVRKLRTKRVA